VQLPLNGFSFVCDYLGILAIVQLRHQRAQVPAEQILPLTANG
jgi:hypothetical protein